MDTVTTALLAFVAAAGLLTITPGLDTALVLRTAAVEGSRRAVLAAIGILSGCLCWAFLVAAGLAALLAVSRMAYEILRLAGAAYLIWMGWRMLRHPRTQLAAPGEASGSAWGAFARGALTNLLNPKVGIFYISFLPGFVPHGEPVGPFIFLLGVIHAALGAAWFACLILACAPIARALRLPAVLRKLDRATGALFVTFGVGLALETRRV
jgi:threonine/homoserine/homoserine lactone efflux protein